MTLHLVTGHAGKIHVTAAEQGDFNARVFGSGAYIINGCDAWIVDENTVHVDEGTMLVQGRHVNVNDGGEDVTITNGTVGLRRRDVICLQYKMDTGDGVETVEFAVVKGEPAEDWETPVIEPQSILDGDNPCLIPLWSVDIDTDRTVGNLQLWADDISGHSDVLEYIGSQYDALDEKFEDYKRQLDFPVAVEMGGTGADNTEDAKKNLGIAEMIDSIDHPMSEKTVPTTSLLLDIAPTSFKQERGTKRTAVSATVEVAVPFTMQDSSDYDYSPTRTVSLTVRKSDIVSVVSSALEPSSPLNEYSIFNIDVDESSISTFEDTTPAFARISKLTSTSRGEHEPTKITNTKALVSNCVFNGDSVTFSATITIYKTDFSNMAGSTPLGTFTGVINFYMQCNAEAEVAYGYTGRVSIFEDVSDKFGYNSSQLAFVKASKMGNIVFVNIGTVSNQTGNFNVQINDESVVPADWGQGLRSRLALGEGMSVSSIIYAQDNGGTGSTTGKGFRVYNGSAGTLSFFYFVN